MRQYGGSALVATIALGAGLLLSAGPAGAAAPTVSGTVTFGGQPVAGVEVWAFANLYGVRGLVKTSHTLTDAQGRYSMPVPARPNGPGQVCAYVARTVPGWTGSTLPTCYGATARRPAAAIGFDRSHTGVDIAVRAAATAVGTLLRSGGSAPGSGWVELSYAGATGHKWPGWGSFDDDSRKVSTTRHVLTEADGGYHVDGLAPGRYELRAGDAQQPRDPCLADAAPQSVTVSPTAGLVAVPETRLPAPPATGTLRIRVAAAELPRNVTIIRDGRDCRTLTAKGGTEPRTLDAQLPPGRYSVQVDRSYRIPQAIVAAGATVQVGPTRLTPATRLGAVTGRFRNLAGNLDQGRLSAGENPAIVRVPIYGDHGRELVDRDVTVHRPGGRFAVRGLPPGRYHIGPARVAARVRPGRTMHLGDIRGFSERGALQGRILGTSKPTLSISLEPVNRKSRAALAHYLTGPRITYVGPAGRWRLPQVPAGRYRVVVSDFELMYPFYGVRYVGGHDAATARVVRVKPGRTVKHLRVRVTALPTPN